MPVDLSSLLADTLSARGFEVEDGSPVEGASGASYPVSLVVRRDGERLIVDALASRPVRERDAEALASIASDAGVDGAILLAVEGAEPGAREAEPDRVEVWGRERVEAAVGAAVLDDALAGARDPDAVGPTPAEAAESQPASASSQTPSAEPAAAGPSSGGAAPGASADAGDEPDAGASPGTGVDQREFVDPEDMLERAERLMEQGAAEDGDAELIVEDDGGGPGPSETGRDPPAGTPSRDEPAREPASPTGDGPGGGRPRPDAEPPEPETASTARGASGPGDERAGQGDASGQPSASPARAVGADEDPSFLSGATVEPEVDEAEARRKAQEALFEVDEARLELLPFHVYRYSAQLEGDGHTREEEGRLWVSTQTGAPVRPPTGELVEEPEVPCERFQGSLDKAETEGAAREHLLDRLQRREEMRQDYSESAIIERVQLEPVPETLDLEDRGKAYAPRWRLEGGNGTVFVDAVTGELVNG